MSQDLASQRIIVAIDNWPRNSRYPLVCHKYLVLKLWLNWSFCWTMFCIISCIYIDWLSVKVCLQDLIFPSNSLLSVYLLQTQIWQVSYLSNSPTIFGGLIKHVWRRVYMVNFMFVTGVQIKFGANLKDKFGSVNSSFLDVQCQIFHTYLGWEQV